MVYGWSDLRTALMNMQGASLQAFLREGRADYREVFLLISEGKSAKKIRKGLSLSKGRIKAAVKYGFAKITRLSWIPDESA